MTSFKRVLFLLPFYAGACGLLTAAGCDDAATGEALSTDGAAGATGAAGKSAGGSSGTSAGGKSGSGGTSAGGSSTGGSHAGGSSAGGSSTGGASAGGSDGGQGVGGASAGGSDGGQGVGGASAGGSDGAGVGGAGGDVTGGAGGVGGGIGLGGAGGVAGLGFCGSQPNALYCNDFDGTDALGSALWDRVDKGISVSTMQSVSSPSAVFVDQALNPNPDFGTIPPKADPDPVARFSNLSKTIAGQNATHVTLNYDMYVSRLPMGAGALLTDFKLFAADSFAFRLQFDSGNSRFEHTQQALPAKPGDEFTPSFPFPGADKWIHVSTDVLFIAGVGGLANKVAVTYALDQNVLGPFMYDAPAAKVDSITVQPGIATQWMGTREWQIYFDNVAVTAE